ncbi:GNAT family N-acetyltransferase [Allobranchiibius sp. CTAmp26]|nr:GNAT family N-acetyltransferase [Allobranchiibius sp. CTAmp26]
MRDDLVVEQTAIVSQMPPAAEVEDLYARASAVAPLSESPHVAGLFAGLYQHARDLPGAVAMTARREEALVGFAYGHPWSWETATDSWSEKLADRLGGNAAALEDSMVVELLAVAPSEARNGLGTRLLQGVMSGSDRPTCWLVTTDLDTPARRLYQRCGWTSLGHGPDAPNGSPSLVMIHHRGDLP